ncbi:sensor domain-containing diguanylate cyclase [Ramlibacter sp.]|uniref:sensor domain-containing diguanylate cyclase n=1 Tax=Ramlibacter sp. TaxID=1917967 RepID=UPI002C157FC6|nr:7TM diverse intracellular signaling domain-containing protein [Ramlibacter sp.]HWI81458.1 7TM diverse intracellular signaling domain-containing protein [Ramlibacter sp.]
MRLFAACWLGALLWLFGVTGALAQQAGPTAAAPLDPIVLSPAQHLVPLSGRSRSWIDPTGFRTVDQVEASAPGLSWGVHQRDRRYELDDKALWVQFDAQVQGERRFFLQVTSSHVSKAQLFYRAADGRWHEQVAGNSQSVSEWPVPGRYPTFELAGPAERPVRYWLRIEQEHVDFSAPLRLYDFASLLAAREQNQFVLGAYFGLAGLIALGALANALAFRDRNFAVFALYVGALAAGQLAAFGLGEQHLWDGATRWNEVAMFLLPGISSSAGIWFARNVTEPARFSRALDLAVWSVIAALLSAAALDTVLGSPASFLLLMVLTLVGIGVIVGLLVLVWTQGEDPHIGLIAAGFVPILLMGLLTVLAGLDILAPTPLTRDGLALGAALGLPILFYALSLRTSHRREAQLRAAALTRHDVLTGIAHEGTLLQRLESAIDRARDLKQQCALVTLDIANFDALSAEFGRETADRALVVAASLLRRAATDIDVEARVGEHQFALLLESPTTAENAVNRAQELVARGLRSSNALPPMASIKFHAAVALLPHERLDAKASLQWLMDALEAMPADSRKAIRPMNF